MLGVFGFVLWRQVRYRRSFSHCFFTGLLGNAVVWTLDH
jgi:hypothetical protein